MDFSSICSNWIVASAVIALLGVAGASLYFTGRNQGWHEGYQDGFQEATDGQDAEMTS